MIVTDNLPDGIDTVLQGKVTVKVHLRNGGGTFEYDVFASTQKAAANKGT